jgi:NCS1 family nucleobase:cation symporter-1
MVPLGTIVVALIGILCTSCAAQIFPEQSGVLLWEPYRLFTALQMHYDNSSRSRAAAAFASLAFAVAQFGMVVANNGVSAGIDLASLFPRWFTIRRGMHVMACLAFIIQPWQLLNGASKFLNVLGGYGVFLGAMIGILFSDYFIVRKRKLKLTDLYEASPASIYWYWKGCNWRALVAWVMGVWINMPGFVQRVRDPTVELAGWSRMYYMSWPLGATLAILTYWALNVISPVPGIGEVDADDFFGTFGSSESMVEGVDVDGTTKGQMVNKTASSSHSDIEKV